MVEAAERVIHVSDLPYMADPSSFHGASHLRLSTEEEGVSFTLRLADV